MSNPTTINTGGGASVGSDVQAARDFIGRDQLNISVHLKDVNDAAQVTRTLTTALSKGDLESESIRTDFLSLMEELRKTHSTIVKTISPLRRIKDDEATFEKDFNATYNDFRDFYDAYDFWDERTHCHKIRQISQRLKKHHTAITQRPEWDQLQHNLEVLSEADTDLIEMYFRPFMQRFNDVMVKINQHVSDREIGQGITLKQVFLNELTAQYDSIKDMLRLMTDVIANIEASLA